MFINKKIPHKMLINNKMFTLFFCNLSDKKKAGNLNTRSGILKTYDQIRSFFLFATERCDLLDYVDRGNVVIYFTYNKKNYGLLVSLKSDSSGISLSLLTLSMICDKYIVHYKSFCKEKFSIIMEGFVLHKPLFKIFSFKPDIYCKFVVINDNKFKITTTSSAYNWIKKINYEINFLEDFIYHIIENNFYNYFYTGYYYVNFKFFKDKNLFMKFFIEEISLGIFTFNIISFSFDNFYERGAIKIPDFGKNIFLKKNIKEMSYKERKEFMFNYY